ncbi:3-oxoacyl-ACP synthase [Symbiobacterium terraclitae]|uniref:3-oxoacyl-ACP synthase n=1 Tax=Symbiobacterium terraclitae TaxID=557451 RepID=UPI0035B5255A
MEKVGLRAFNIYMPAREETAAEIAARSGLPEAVVREKMGVERKRRADPDEHVSDMAVKAARPLLAQVAPEEIDAVIYFGSPHKDYAVWLAAPKIQYELGLRQAVAFEVAAVSVGCPIALNVARSLLLANPGMRSVLLVGASREGALIDYANARSRFMFNFGDGAAAAILQRGYGHNLVLETAAVTDGSFHDFVKVPAGGSKLPASEATVRERLHFLDVTDPAEMKQRLDPVSFERFVGVAREAVVKSGHRPEEIRFVAMLHTKRSLFEQVMAALGVPPERQVYLDQYGHMSAIDPLVALHKAVQRRLLSPGDLVVLLSAGTGYTWGATALRWG